MRRFIVLILALTLVAGAAFSEGQQEGETGEQEMREEITLVGGTMLPTGHVYYKVIEKFAEEVKARYDGPLKVELHHSGDIGSEKDMFEFMKQGTSVDFSIISPSWMATWVETAPFMDAPFLFRNVDHWEKAVVDERVFEPIARKIEEEGVRLIGYGGGGVRNLVLTKQADEMDELPDVEMRVQGSPLHQKVFSATGIQATPMDYGEVYNAINTGVVDGLENEIASVDQMKFYEVAPYYIITNHQITTRPLCFSETRLQSFNEDLRNAILEAGEAAAAFHREQERSKANRITEKLQEEHDLNVVQFKEPEQLRESAMPALKEFAEEQGVLDIVNEVQSISVN